MRLSRIFLLLLLAAPLAACPTANDDDSASNDDDATGDDDDATGDDDDATGDDDDATGDDDDATGDDDDSVPDTYSFPSRLGDGTDSVAYTGQTMRHVLIADLKTWISGMTARFDDPVNPWAPTAGMALAEMEFYFDFSSTEDGTVEHMISTTPDPLQSTYGEIGSANLAGKVAGNDATGQHKDWETELVGWSDATFVDSPDDPDTEDLIRHWFGVIDAQAADWALGTYPQDPAGNNVTAVYITADGLDLNQLIQKTLWGAIAFSQGADDYLDDDTPGKGLRSDHDALVSDKPYTGLEHAWDEAVGYFGMPRDFNTWTLDEIATSPNSKDTFMPDGAIDLGAEKAWGNAVNAAKRDRCSSCPTATDMVNEAWDAFMEGRIYIASKSASLTEAEITELAVIRDRALVAWEHAIATTIIHYINDTITDLNTWNGAQTAENFATLAKHWGEMKGFALGLQFNRMSPVNTATNGPAEFAQVHDLMGQAPDLVNVTDYVTDLEAARGLVIGWYPNLPSENVSAW